MSEKNEQEKQPYCDTHGGPCGCGRLSSSPVRILLVLFFILATALFFSLVFSDDSENKGEREAGARVVGGTEESEEKESGHVHKISSVSEFDKKLAGAEKPVVVDFSATWCPACRTYDPIYKKAAKKLHEEALFLKVSVDKVNELGKRYNIRYLPTTVLITEGKEAGRFTGVKGVDEIKEMLEEKASK